MTDPGADIDDTNPQPQEAAAAPAACDSTDDKCSERAPQGDASPCETSKTLENADAPASNLMILWPERPSRDGGDAAFGSGDGEPRSGRSSLRRRRRVAVAAGIALAAVSGAAGGWLTTFALNRVGTPQTALAPEVDNVARLKDALARVTADLGNLRADLDRSGHARTTQIAKLGDRLDKVEKAQDDTTVRLTKLSDIQERQQEKTQDRMRVAGASSAAAETTGSISTPAAAKGDMGIEVRKSQVVDGWTLTRITRGGAIVNGPDGLYEAFPGDPLPGLGRVDAVRYQDGRWVVITPKGMIIRR